MSETRQRPLIHGSLFSGIGGFDLAAQWAGWTNAFHVEINPFCRRVLKHYWPNAKSFEDVNEFDPKPFAGTIDVVSGGFPCQPFSTAGQRRGTADERHLWPRMFEIIEQIRPRFVVGENVFGIINWSDGLVFESVCADLENIGYEIASYCLPCASINAPHKRDRIFVVAKRIVANADGGDARSNGGTNGGTSDEIRRDETRVVFGTHGIRGDVANAEGERTDQEVDGRRKSQFDDRSEIRNRFGTNGIEPNVANATNVRLEHGAFAGGMESGKKETRPCTTNTVASDGGHGNVANANGIVCARRNDDRTDGRQIAERVFEPQHRAKTWSDFPTQSPICGRNDGISGRLDGISFPKWRRESIKGYGNAVSPQLAWRIFDTINNMDQDETQTNHRAHR